MVQEAMLHNNKFTILGIELVVSEGLPENISGKLDIIAKHNETGKITLWDIKSVRPNAFKYGDLIKPSYKIQVNTYRIGWETIYHKIIDKMFVFILDRSGTNVPFIGEIERINGIEMDVRFEKYQKAINKYIESKEIPPVLDYEVEAKLGKNKVTNLMGKSNWECGYCQHHEIVCPAKIYKSAQVGSIDSYGVVKIDNFDFKDAIDKKVKEYINN
jgi:hypothetical protein